MTQDQYLSLCEKYLSGNCSSQEEILIKEYQNENGLADDDLSGLAVADKERIRELLYNKLQSNIHQPERRIVKMRTWYYAAAAILVFISAGIYIISNRNAKNASALASVVKKVKAIQPGSNKAILTLANGKHITLDDAQNGLLSKEGNSAISKSGNGIVIKNGGDNAQIASNTLNTITIPRGGKYNITLPDGTKVWLNSSSSLTFPTAFTGADRKVAITGEAYFEVAKNPEKPFKIDVNGKQVVEVLGTHFNISAYADEHNITTTLLEGSVKIDYHNKATLIKPGQMAINNLEQDVVVEPANIEETMAWKNDMFIFTKENITSIMKKVSRWYDVDVVFKGDMSKINFDGNYSREKGLESLLKNIELVDKVRFVTEERRITVIAK